MVSSTNAAYNLTVYNAASGHYALMVMTIVTVIFFPLVLLYQGWSFHVFRALAWPETPIRSPARRPRRPHVRARRPAAPLRARSQASRLAACSRCHSAA